MCIQQMVAQLIIGHFEQLVAYFYTSDNRAEHSGTVVSGTCNLSGELCDGAIASNSKQHDVAHGCEIEHLTNYEAWTHRNVSFAGAEHRQRAYGIRAIICQKCRIHARGIMKNANY